ncbi:MAG TPA: S53 family serine peptidase, partial [Acidimicrobiales bacterium]|nr:S53 family serine peptidase [Acidimicrobiales bacterium]
MSESRAQHTTPSSGRRPARHPAVERPPSWSPLATRHGAHHPGHRPAAAPHPRAQFPRARGCLLLLLLLLGVLAGLALSPLFSRAGSASSLVRLGGVLAPPPGSVLLGPVPPRRAITLDVVLVPRDPAGLAALASSVSDPSSPRFRHFLAPAAVAARFAPSRAVVSAVRSGLAARGLSGGVLSDGGLVVSYATTAGVLESAFSLGLSDYRVPGRPSPSYGASAGPLLGRAIAPAVAFVAGLSDFDAALAEGAPESRAVPGRAVTSSGSSGGPVPCAAAVATGGMTADTLASAYDLSPLYGAGDFGQGVRVALFELEPFRADDVARYASCYGLAPRLAVQRVDGGAGVGAGSGEAASDVESLLSVAPRARLSVYEGPWSESGVIDTYSAIVLGSRAAVLSTSWGICEGELSPGLSAAEDSIFEEAAAGGMSVVAASGDHGSEDCATGWGSPADALSVADPAAQPFVTGVGGTTLSPGPRGQLRERVWNVPGSFGGSGGGGASADFPEPSFQRGVAPGAPGRLVPDVSAFSSSSTGDAVVQDGVWSTYGGTSIAAPTWAGLLALADAEKGCAAPVGFADPLLYRLAGRAPAAHFHDITSGDNDYLGDHPGAYGATVGYDRASGLGSP